MLSVAQQLCTFRLAGLEFGLDVLSVQEVLTARELIPVPMSSRLIAGLLNLRGQVVTAIDLRKRLGLPESEASRESAMFIIVRSEDGPVAFVVDAVGDVVEPAPEAFEAPPETLPANLRGLITGVYKLPRQLLHVLEGEVASRISESESHQS